MKTHKPGRVREAARALSLLVLASLVLVTVFVTVAWQEARSDPVVHRMTVRLPRWPAGVAAVRVALLSDIHIGSPATTPARLEHVVAQVNALHPDLVVIAGDFVAGHDRDAGRRYAPMLRRPLANLRAPLGVVAVLGNHDHWTDASAVRRALASAGVTVLANEAVERGPLAVIGVDDGFTGHADIGRSITAAQALRGVRIVVTHPPDTAASLPRGTVALVMAGHTHCGQVVLPLIGPVVINSPKLGRALYDPRWRCGAVVDGNRVVVVTGGIGASLPLRLGAPPDLWLLTLGP